MHTLFWAVVVSFSMASTVSASAIGYEVANVAGNSWQYEYLVENNSLSGSLVEFSVFFDLGLYENLSVTATPEGWDGIVAQPDPELPDDGFFDALALSGGIASGTALRGFLVRFDWLGTGTPASQAFDVVDPLTLEVLESGQTTPVPEPSVLTLLPVGLAMLRARRSACRRVSP
jgi:hypothetical protein